jgi:hypothetical protein
VRRVPSIFLLTSLGLLGALGFGALAGCGDKTAPLVAKLGATVTPTPRPKPTPSPTPAPGPNTLTVAGDVTVNDPDPEVVTIVARAGDDAAAGAGSKSPVRLRLEVRHRPQGSSQADSVLVFFNVPATSGVYPLHAPEDPPVPGRVYAYFTSRGEAVGSMKDFNTSVVGKLELSKSSDAVLSGSFQFAAQEPPPPPPPAPKPGQPSIPVVGTIPPTPPAHVQASGKLLAHLDELQSSDASAPF